LVGFRSFHTVSEAGGICVFTQSIAASCAMLHLWTYVIGIDVQNVTVNGEVSRGVANWPWERRPLDSRL